MIFCEVIEALCRNPGQYTMGGTFEEIVAWIEGYTMNARRHRNDARFQLYRFNNWLASKRNYSNHIVAYTYLRQTYANDSEALAELARLFREFVAESEEVNKQSSSATEEALEADSP